MKQIFDEESANDAHCEDKAVRAWEQEQKNKILSSSLSSAKKQSLWGKVFPKPTYPKVIEQMVW